MELVNLYNIEKERTNKTWERSTDIEPEEGEFKFNVHTWLINDNNEFLIQKRGVNLKRHPGKWNFTGGAVDAGESSVEGAKREVKEELGINIDTLEFLLSYRREHDFVDVWVGRTNADIEDLDTSDREVDEVRWVSFQELKNMINNNEFVPSVKLYLELFEKLLEKLYGIK